MPTPHRLHPLWLLRPAGLQYAVHHILGNANTPQAAPSVAVRTCWLAICCASHSAKCPALHCIALPCIAPLHHILRNANTPQGAP
eukprot:1149323-Pelagomonas_calceolata.AAC.4